MGESGRSLDGQQVNNGPLPALVAKKANDILGCIKKNYPPPLLCSSKAASGVLCTVLCSSRETKN